MTYSVLSDFELLRPWWLCGIPISFVLVWLYTRYFDPNEMMKRVVDPALHDDVLHIPNAYSPLKKKILLISILVLSFIALSGPSFQKVEQPLVSKKSGLILVLDMSFSMAATDISPSRYQIAKFKIRDILATRDEGQTALIAYAGDAHVVVPLTTDTATIEHFLDGLSPQTMPVYGSKPQRGIEAAAAMITRNNLNNAQVLIFTDGFPANAIAPMAALAKNMGMQIGVLAIGTKQKVPIALSGGALLRDNNDNIVVATYEPETLQKFAQQANAAIIAVDSDSNDIEYLLRTTQPDVTVSKTKQSKILALDQGYWLIIPLLLCFVLGVRQGYIFCILLVVVPLPGHAMEIDWSDILGRQHRQAQQAIMQDDFAAAVATFHDPRWQGYAAYKNGDFQQAIDILQNTSDPTSRFNLGNAYLQLQQFKPAISAYEKVLASAGISQQLQQDAQANIAFATASQQEQQAGQQQDQQGQQGQQGKQGQQGQQDQQDQQGTQDQQGQQGQQGKQGQQGQQDQQDQQGTQDQQGQQGTQGQQGQQDQQGQQGQQSASQSQSVAAAHSQQAQSDHQEGMQQANGNQQQLGQHHDAENTGNQNGADNNEEAQNTTMQQQHAAANQYPATSVFSMDSPTSTPTNQIDMLLDKIEDNPSELLQRKFYNEQQRRNQGQSLTSDEVL